MEFRRRHGCLRNQAMRGLRISSSTPPDAAPSLSLRHETGHQEFEWLPSMSCCNRSADHSRGDHNWHRCRLCHMRLCHPGRRALTDWKGVMTFGQAPQNSRGGLMLPARLPYSQLGVKDYQTRGGSTLKNPAPESGSPRRLESEGSKQDK